MISYIEFIALTPVREVAVQEATLKLWHHIYCWVSLHNYADTADTPEFVRYVKSFRIIEASTINTHLGRMARIGLLKRHTLKRRLSTEIKETLANPILAMFSGSTLPTTFTRYTLPNTKCPLGLQSAARKMERFDDLMRPHIEHGTAV